MNLKKPFLIFSGITIFVIAGLYSINPAWFVDVFLGSATQASLDFSHIMRAVSGMYVAFGCYWLYGAFNKAHQDSALLVLMLFCAGLATGRVFSICLDGTPSAILVLYTLMEFAIVPICLWLRKQA